MIHGGNLADARRSFPGALEPFLDLSTGINPVPYPVPTLDDGCFTRLPEAADIAALERIAAAGYGVADPASVVAAPGTQSLIQLLPRLTPRSRVAILGPTYGEHARCWLAAGHAVRDVATLDEASGHDVVVVCNPNNPDGRRMPPDRLRALAASAALLVVDEAFADFEPDLSLAPTLPSAGVVVLRSFGKAYGLAGVRLGFALAGPDRAARLRDAVGPWAVSGSAIAIAAKALADRDWLANAARRLVADTARLDQILIAAGFCLVGGTTLYRLMWHRRAPDIFDRLGRAGILVRRFEHDRGWLRFGIPASTADFDRLQGVLGQA